MDNNYVKFQWIRYILLGDKAWTQKQEELANGLGPQIRVPNEKLSSYFSTKTYVVGTQKNRLTEMVLLSTQNIIIV